MSKMITRPNAMMKKGDAKIKPYELGNNHLALRFKNRAFSILLDSGYYEGTVFGQYYNTFDSTGKSSIYVEQPETEKALDVFLKTDSDCIKYLVGYTGIGKTTVIRNYFHIYDRNIRVVDESLIIYHSFYSKGTNNTRKDQVWDSYKNTIKKQ